MNTCIYKSDYWIYEEVIIDLRKESRLIEIQNKYISIFLLLSAVTVLKLNDELSHWNYKAQRHKSPCNYWISLVVPAIPWHPFVCVYVPPSLSIGDLKDIEDFVILNVDNFMNSGCGRHIIIFNDDFNHILLIIYFSRSHVGHAHRPLVLSIPPCWPRSQQVSNWFPGDGSAIPTIL